MTCAIFRFGDDENDMKSLLPQGAILGPSAGSRLGWSALERRNDADFAAR